MKSFTLLLKMAFRNILRNRRRTALTSLMMITGFVFASASFSLIDGTYGHLIALFTGQYTGHIQITRSGYTEAPSLQKSISHYPSVLHELKQAQYTIRAMAPRIYGEALVYLNNKTFGAQVVGIDPQKESVATHYEQRILLGKNWRLPLDADNNSLTDAELLKLNHEVLVGKTLAKILHIQLNNELALISQGADGSISNDLYKVRGIIGSDQESKDDYRIYMTLAGASDFFSLINQVSEISIQLIDFQEAQGFATKLNNPTSSFHKDFPHLVAKPWQEVESDFYKAMQTDKSGNRVSLFTLMLMVGVGVLNTVLMSTLERTREFGVLKAMGTLPQYLFALILLEGFILSLFCALVGGLFSWGINHYLTFTGIHLSEPISFAGMVLTEMRGTLSVKVFIYPTLILMTTSFIASLYPGWKASKISVAKALREF